MPFSYSGNKTKVLILGIDGMDLAMTRELIKQGKLPHFEKLGQDGSFIPFHTVYPPHSPVGWATIGTGVNPGKHNIFDFIRRDPADYLPKLSLSKLKQTISGVNYESYVSADPFWKYLNDKSIPSTMIHWPMTFPPEKVEGNMLSGLGVPDIKGLLSGYTFYTNDKNKINDSEESKKIVFLEGAGNNFTTEIFGPKTLKGGEVVSVTLPMQIKILPDKNKVILTIQDQDYVLKKDEWSEWIRVKFKVSMFKNVFGTFKAYFSETDPLGLYFTTIQIDPENPMVPISAPEVYSADLSKKIGLFYTLGIAEETDGLVDGVIDQKAFQQQTQEIEAERDKIFWFEFEKFKKQDSGVLAFVYDTSDRIQHTHWMATNLDGRDESAPLPIHPFVEEYYRKKDVFLGEVLNQIDDDTAVFIISDHGFSSFERAVSLNTWLEKNNYLNHSTPLKVDEEGALFEKVDWSKTQAYALGFNSIYINQKGREGQGIVEDREAMMNRIIEGLEGLIDPKTGKKVIYKVYKREEIWSGEYLENAPDLVVGYYPGYRSAWQTAVGGFTDEVLSDNKKAWNGDHLIDPKFVPGVLFSNQKLKKDSAEQVDFVPTVLALLGISIPEELDGESLLK